MHMIFVCVGTDVEGQKHLSIFAREGHILVIPYLFGKALHIFQHLVNAGRAENGIHFYIPCTIWQPLTGIMTNKIDIYYAGHMHARINPFISLLVV